MRYRTECFTFLLKIDGIARVGHSLDIRNFYWKFKITTIKIAEKEIFENRNYFLP